jgi:hypothetical protein
MLDEGSGFDRMAGRIGLQGGWLATVKILPGNMGQATTLWA